MVWALPDNRERAGRRLADLLADLDSILASCSPNPEVLGLAKPLQPTEPMAEPLAEGEKASGPAQLGQASAPGDGAQEGRLQGGAGVLRQSGQSVQGSEAEASAGQEGRSQDGSSMQPDATHALLSEKSVEGPAGNRGTRVDGPAPQATTGSGAGAQETRGQDLSLAEPSLEELDKVLNTAAAIAAIIRGSEGAALSGGTIGLPGLVRSRLLRGSSSSFSWNRAPSSLTHSHPLFHLCG